jgi:hypothetical protein
VNPLLLPTRGEKRVRMEIAVPSEYQVEYLPPDTFRRNAAGAGIDVRTHAAMEAGKEDRKVIAEAEARMKPAVVPPFRYQELLDLDETLSRKHGRMILLRAPLPAPAVTNAPAGP